MAKRTYNGAFFYALERVFLHPASHEWRADDFAGTVQKTTKGGARVHILTDNGRLVNVHASTVSTVQR